MATAANIYDNDKFSRHIDAVKTRDSAAFYYKCD